MSPLLPLLLIVVSALAIVSLTLLYASAAIADSTFDGLTGLMVPHAFRRLVREEIARAQATQGRSISLWFIDTDHFKRINDAFGHRAGDAVLVSIASLLRRHLKRKLDVAARNGGDEFCALLRGATKSSAIDRAQRFCDAVRAHDFGLPVRITASIGVAAFPSDVTSSGALLEAADAAMYYSKQNGRDRVSFASEAGTYASRTPMRWPSNGGEPCAE